MKKILLGALVISIIAGVAATTATSSTTTTVKEDRGYVMANGSANKDLTPDTAQISFSVVTYDKTSMQKASDENKEISEKIGFPLIVKPVNLGSSVGITKVNTEAELDEAIMLGFSFSDRILIEHAITALREINCSVLGDSDSCEASVCEEPFMNDEILSYEDKYLGGNTKSSGASKGMASLGRKIPADLTKKKSNEIRDLACKVFKAIGANGVVRIDFIIDTDTDTVYANEINTIPGSLAFYLWDATGIKYTDLLDRLVDIAFKRQRKRENLSFTIDTNILSGASFGSKGAKGSKL